MPATPPTLAEWLVTHPWDNPETVVPTTIDNAYSLNQGENVLVDLTVTDDNNDPIPATDIKDILLSIRRGEATAIEWSWITDGPQDSQILVDEDVDGHVFLEIAKEDTVLLAGLYDFEAQISIVNTDFFYSGAQSTVMEAKAPIFIRSVPVNFEPEP